MDIEAIDIHGNPSGVSISQISAMYAAASEPYDQACMLLRGLLSGQAEPKALEQAIDLLEASATPFDQLIQRLKIS